MQIFSFWQNRVCNLFPLVAVGAVLSVGPVGAAIGSAVATLQDPADPSFSGDPRPSRQATLLNPPIAVLRTLDKVTARIKEVSVQVGQTVQIGTLKVAPRYCRSTPPIETPETYGYLTITDLGRGAKDKPRVVFDGWMVASSPALNPLEHAVYDVWVIACKTSAGDAFTGNASQFP